MNKYWRQGKHHSSSSSNEMTVKKKHRGKTTKNSETLFFLNSFRSQGSGGSALRPRFLLYVHYLAGCQDSNQSCGDRRQGCATNELHTSLNTQVYVWQLDKECFCKKEKKNVSNKTAFLYPGYGRITNNEYDCRLFPPDTGFQIRTDTRMNVQKALLPFTGT